MNVKFVEGWDSEGDLFERAPGTAPGTFLAITVEGTKSKAEQSFPPSMRVDEEIAAFDYRKAAGLVSVVFVR